MAAARQQILERLSKGDIGAEEAATAIRSLGLGRTQR